MIDNLLNENRRLDQRLRRANERRAAAHGISIARLRILDLLAAQELTVSQLARRLDMTRQSVQRTVDMMTEEGWIAAFDNPDHRRAKLFAPTEEARQALHEVRLDFERWQRRLESGLDQERVDSASGLLADLSLRVESDLEGIQQESDGPRSH